MKTVYIATSTRNFETYKALVEVLVSHGFHVLDWTPNLPGPGPDFETRKDEDPHGRIFAFTRDACGGSDLFVYLEPCGKDAACELGMAFAAGVETWGYAPPGVRIGTTVAGCVHRWFHDLEAMQHELTRWRGW